MPADGDQPLPSALVVERAGHPDRLVRRAEVGVATDLDGDVAAQPADEADIVAFRRLGQPPPDVQLVEPFGRPAAGLDDQRRLAEMRKQVIELGGDVAGVEIDHHRLHLPDVGRLGTAELGTVPGTT